MDLREVGARVRAIRCWAVLVAAVSTLTLTSCSAGQGSAFGYGQGDGTGSTSSEPTAHGQKAMIGVTLDNRSSDPVELVSFRPMEASNITIGGSFVAPVLRQRDGSWLAFGVNQVADDPMLVQEWARRQPADGFRIRGKQKNLQGLLEVSVRDPSRPARVIGVVIRYRQGGQTVSETTSETACFFTPHRMSACDLPH